MQCKGNHSSSLVTFSQILSNAYFPQEKKTNPFLLFIVKHDVVWHGISLWSVGVSPFPTSCQAQLSWLGYRMGKRERLNGVQCSATAKICRSVVATDPNCSTLWAAVWELSPSQSNPEQCAIWITDQIMAQDQAYVASLPHNLWLDMETMKNIIWAQSANGSFKIFTISPSTLHTSDFLWEILWKRTNAFYTVDIWHCFCSSHVPRVVACEREIRLV